MPWSGEKCSTQAEVELVELRIVRIPVVDDMHTGRLRQVEDCNVGLGWGQITMELARQQGTCQQGLGRVLGHHGHKMK